MDAVASARRLLARFGSLRALLEKPTSELIEEPGLGPARVCALKAALELGSRHLAAGLERGEALTDPARAGEYFARRLRGLPHEVFAGLFLDNRHRAIAFEELFHPTLDGAEVYPREVLKRCLAHNAAALIVAPQPSQRKLRTFRRRPRGYRAIARCARDGGNPSARPFRGRRRRTLLAGRARLGLSTAHCAGAGPGVAETRGRAHILRPRHGPRSAGRLDGAT
jgi:DNA repair protein RadC